MFLTAQRIHDGHRFLPQGSVIEVSAEGEIIALHGKERQAEAEHVEGTLVPGFVNVHCHLELSHMKGVIPEATGLIPFLQQVPAQRFRFDEEAKKQARFAALQQMVDEGIVAVGDIANTTDTLDTRAGGQLHFQTFVESIGFTSATAQLRFDAALEVYQAFQEQKIVGKILGESIVPHAPYSVSEALFRRIGMHVPDGVMSIHNQESLAENEFYQDRSGKVNELLMGLGIDAATFQPYGKGSLPAYIEWLPVERRVIFVHNTYTTQSDVMLAQSRFPSAFWCLCPNANLYIESRLPDVVMLAAESGNMCIGTDSLASNHQLSVLAELETLNKHFPEIGWEALLRWGTSNGARALQMQEIIGTFETGKKPGVLQLNGLDEPGNARVRRII